MKFYLNNKDSWMMNKYIKDPTNPFSNKYT